jgi:hypothetical protein
MRQIHKQTMCGLFLIAGVLTSGLLLFGGQKAYAANPTTLNFQGKVVNSNGTNVTDGTYSFVFRLYDNSTPTIGANCNSNSQCWWEETQASVTALCLQRRQVGRP